MPHVKRTRLELPILRAVDAIYASLPTIRCKGLCQDCCSPVGNLMTEFERDRIIGRTGKRPNDFPVGRIVFDGQKINVIDKDMKNQCNLLGVDGRCTIYDIRPLVCRLWGVAPPMICPHGCEVERLVERQEGDELLRSIQRATRGHGEKS